MDTHDSETSEEDVSFVAKGSYGCVVKPALRNRSEHDRKWTSYPKNVTKLFFTRKNMKKAFNDSKHMYELLGHNKGHKTYKYKHSYNTSNIPRSVFEKCKKLKSDAPLYPLRMRNLGYDIWSTPRNYKEFRKIHVGIILDQIVKVMKQIKKLVDRRLIHGDVRETNIMVNPKSGDITLIDFDLLNPVETFFDLEKGHLGFYCHPPEAFLYNDIKSLLESTKAGHTINAIFESRDISERIDKYVEHHSEFEFANPENLNRTVSRAELILDLKKSLRFYATHLDATLSKDFLQTAMRETMLPSFDGYGLAFSLLEFLTHVYPPVMRRIQKDTYDESLKSRISDGRRAYSSEQIRTIRTTLHKLVFEVLEPMVSLRIQDRMMITDALEATRALVKEFHASM